MYTIIKQVILSGSYELSAMLETIKKNCVRGDITAEQETELLALARQHATPENSYASLEYRVETLEKENEELKATMKSISDRVTVLEGGEVEPEPEPEEYPEYVQPTGAHDAYHKDDKITYNGVKYVCIAPEGTAVVWSPDDYPNYWQKVEE